MEQIPAGWYADPAPASPGAPPQQRWWDGRQWTEHVQAAPVAAAGPGAYAGQYAGQQSGPYAGAYPGHVDPARTPARTPDGQRLAGWWQRAAAYLLDSVLIAVVTGALGFGFLRTIGAAYGRLLDQAQTAAQSGTPLTTSGVLDEVAGSVLGLTAVSVVVSLVYNALFLKWRAATPGKMALGLRVRLRERPGPLSWGTVLVRWLTQNIATLLSPVPVLGALARLYPLLDGLWPLWDAKKQALHDKAAATNVVRVRD